MIGPRVSDPRVVTVCALALLAANPHTSAAAVAVTRFIVKFLLLVKNQAAGGLSAGL